MVQLRPYQEADIEAVRQAFASGARAPILVAPTGSGKTTTASEMIRRAVAKGNKVGWLVHRRELVDQASERLDLFGVDHGVIMSGHGRWRPNAAVQVCSVQTLIRRPQFSADLYYIDEAHRALGESYLEILSRSPESRLVGLTATPCRTDGRGLGHLFDALVLSQLSPAELTADGFLVPARVFAPSKPDLTGVKKQAGDYNSKQLAAVCDQPVLVGDIVQHWIELASGRQTVCFATSVRHSQHIVERFLQAGIPAEHLDGTTPLAVREGILRRISSGETRIVSNVGVWTEGVDVPIMSCAIMARPTASLALARQMMGRVLRPHDTKTDAILLDHAGVVYAHGFPTDPVEWSLDGKAKRGGSQEDDGEPIRLCEDCFCQYPSRLGACPECGWRPPVKRIERETLEVDGHLVELTPGKYQGPGKEGWSTNPKIARVQKIAVYMGYKGKWVSRQVQRINQGLPPQIPERVRRTADLTGWLV